MILIRADANSQIGAGHIMRCLSIASAFAAKGKECLFVTADKNSDVLLEQKKARHICLDSVWNDLESEIDRFYDIISEYSPELVIADSYFVTRDYLEAVSERAYTAYIDDLNKAVWPVDVLINYNIFSSVFDYSAYEGTGTRLLLGTGYTPLREEFGNIGPREIKDSVTDILVSAGGSDPQNITEKIMLGISGRPEWKNIKFHFVAGALNPRIEKIKQTAESMENAVLHINEKNMSGLMRSCDAAISASGATLYELCACGTPTLTYTLADNQIIAAEQFEKRGIMLSAGDCRSDPDFIPELERQLYKIVKDGHLRNELSLKMQTLVDGKGAGRIAAALGR